MRVAILGAGAMGCLAAYLLRVGGAEVVLYESRGERRETLRERGVQLRGDLEGYFTPQIGAAGDVTPPFDVIILAVGSLREGEAIRAISPYVHKETIYLSFQEGSAVTALAEIVGEERAFGAVLWVSAIEAPGGEVEVEELRSIVMGAMLPGEEARLAPLAAMMDASRPGRVAVTPRLDREIWKRLEVAAGVSGLCALAGLAPEAARERREIDQLCRESALECGKTAASAGVQIRSAESPWDKAVWRAAGPPMLRDVEAARRTEAPYLSGFIIDRARIAGVPTPTHNAIFSLIREMESGLRSPGDTSIKELMRRIEEERGMSLL